MSGLIAHLGHSGGSPNYPLLIAAGVALVAGIVVGTSKRARPWMSWAALGTAVILGGISFALPESGAAGGEPRIRFIEPADGARVPAAEPFTVTVAVDGGTVATSEHDTEGGHIHLYVDGDLRQMPHGTQMEVRLPRGTHELKVEYVDNLHASFDPPVETTISVTAR